jgi:hypothetical protein
MNIVLDWAQAVAHLLQNEMFWMGVGITGISFACGYAAAVLVRADR